jgi:hypothetical protein
VRVVDVHDPLNPVEVGAFEPGSGYEAWSVACWGQHAVVGHRDDGASGVHVLDVHDPSQPAAIGSCALPGLPRRIEVSGSLALVAADASGLRVVDLSELANPVEVGSWSLPDDAFAVAVNGTLVYLANRSSGGGGSNGLYVVEVADPTNPADAGHSLSSGQAWDVATSGALVVLADWLGGLLVFEECGGFIFADGFESGDLSAWDPQRSRGG